MTRESCYFCNEDNVDMLEEHHVVPRRFGGSDDDENLVTVCASCHNGLESLYDSRFYDELDVEKQSSKQEGLKSFDEKHPFIWAVRSYCDENSVDYSRRMYSSDVYAKDCSVGFFRNEFTDYVSNYSDKEIVRKLQSDNALRCGLTLRRLEQQSVERNHVVFRLEYDSKNDNFADIASPGGQYQ